MADKPHKRRPATQEVVKQKQMFLVTDFQVGHAWDSENGTYPIIKFYEEEKELIVALRPEAIPDLVKALPAWAPTPEEEGTKQ